MLVQGNIIQSRTWVTSGDQAAVNVRHWVVETHTGNGAELVDFAAALNTALSTPYKAAIATVAVYRGVQTSRIWPLPPTVAENAVTGAGPGVNAGEVLPKQCSGLVGLTTDLAGRKFRGRVFIPFPHEGNNSATAVPDALYLGFLDSIGNAYSSNYTPGVGPDTSFVKPCLPTRVLRAGTGPGTPNPPRYDLTGGRTLITGYIVRPFWATQRRRGSYGRKNVAPI